MERKIAKYKSKLNSSESTNKEVYNRKINRYSNMLYRFNVSNQIFLPQLEDDGFKNWIRNKMKKYFENTTHEFGGTITINNGSYSLNDSEIYDENTGMILYSRTTMKNLRENQILWHTHNVKRKFKTKCEPPSGWDFAILVHLALVNKNPHIFNIAVHTKGIWVYRLIELLNNDQIKNSDSFIEWIIWAGNTIADIYCNDDPNAISSYAKEDLDEYGIKPMKNLEDYRKMIRNVFHKMFDIRFIPLEIN